MEKNQHILVDSCVVSCILSKKEDLREQTLELINSLGNSNNMLAISIFTEHEILRNIDQSIRENALDVIKSFNIIRHSDERQKRATVLYSAYKRNSRIKSQLHSVSDIDTFIGSLVFTKEKPLLLTADYNDFPRPFFKEKEICRIEYLEKKEKRKSIYYYFLEANLEELFNNSH